MFCTAPTMQKALTFVSDDFTTLVSLEKCNWRKKRRIKKAALCPHGFPVAKWVFMCTYCRSLLEMNLMNLLFVSILMCLIPNSE